MNVVREAVQEIRDDDDEDKRKYMRGKTYRSCNWLDGRRNKMTATLLSWTAEPIDHLWMRLLVKLGRDWLST